MPRGRQLVKTAGLTHFALCSYGASQATVKQEGYLPKLSTFPLLGTHAIFLEIPIKMVSGLFEIVECLVGCRLWGHTESDTAEAT